MEFIEEEAERFSELISWHDHNQCVADLSCRYARRGLLVGLKWFEEMDESISVGVMNCAALGGHLEVSKWLAERLDETPTKDTMNYAVLGGNFELVKWLHEEGYPCRESTTETSRVADNELITEYIYNVIVPHR